MANKSKPLTFLSQEEAAKHLWEAHEITSKTLKALSNNKATENLQRSLWEALTCYTDNLKYLKTLQIGAFYKVEDYDKRYYICRIDAFISGSLTIECRVRMLTCTMEAISYNHPPKDEMDLSFATLDGKITELNKEDLPLYVGNFFCGTLLQELLKE